MENKVLIINTGGTIGMVGKPLRPAYNWAEITKGYSVLEKFPTDYYQFEKLIDSSDVTTDFWIKLAEVIEENYDKEIDIDKLAAIAHLSKYYYQRLFFRLTKKTVNDYVKLRR